MKVLKTLNFKIYHPGSYYVLKSWDIENLDSRSKRD